MKAATSCLSTLVALGWTGIAFAQPQPEPEFYKPGTSTTTPAPTATQPPAPAPAPQPAPAATPAPAASAPAASASGSWSFASGATGDIKTDEPAKTELPADAKAKWNAEWMRSHNNLYGSTGLLRVSDAGSGPVGTFRLSLLTEWFTATGFLCTPDRPCVNKATDKYVEDEASHFGTTASLSVTPMEFLEVYGSFRSYANANNKGAPALLQVLGDSILGVKGFTPPEPGKLFRFGGEAQLLLVNGSGGVGLDGGSTGFRLRALGTADFAALQGPDYLPFRVHGNVGYRVDNSFKSIEDTEVARQSRITRIERYGLGINRTDFLEVGLGVEGTFEYVRPFLEYTIDLPVNRQEHICRKNGASLMAYHDSCLGENQSFSYMPSRLTVGARGYPIAQGLAPLVAFDIGTSGTSDFLEETAPESPWMLYIGLGYSADFFGKAPEAAKPVEKTISLPPPRPNIIRGTIADAETKGPVANAIVMVEGMTSGGYASSDDGVFESRDMAPGTYKLSIRAEGYKPGTCSADVKDPNAKPLPAPGQAPAPAPAEASKDTGTGPRLTNITCELEALPKAGGIKGTVLDAKKSMPVPNATVVIMDAKGKEHRITTDETGAFTAPQLATGEAKLQVQADKYMMNMSKASVVPKQDANVQIMLNPRPAKSNVIVTAKQIIIKQKIHFATDQAVIEPDSFGLMEELADVFNQQQAIRRVEVQGHTDNQGSREHNQQLSEKRAQAVVDWLTSHGVDGSRLQAKGFGASQPMVPNVTARNRAQNRRVQFVILERSK